MILSFIRGVISRKQGEELPFKDGRYVGGSSGFQGQGGLVEAYSSKKNSARFASINFLYSHFLVWGWNDWIYTVSQKPDPYDSLA